MISTQHTEDKGENQGQRQLVDSSLITSGEKQPEHVYDNEDLFPTSPNIAYGTAGKTLLFTLCIPFSSIQTTVV